MVAPFASESQSQPRFGTFLREVREQYERFPYPLRNPGDEKDRLVHTVGDEIPKINHYCFAGRETFSDAFRALVAGGGTGDATIFLAEQLRDTNAQIVHLDVSARSIEIAKQRAAARGLQNISWRQESILDLPKIGLGRFDYINCSGVLHHLADPTAGLLRLESALSNKGAINLMVYGKYGRTGVSHVRELMKLINGDEDDLDRRVENTRRVLECLPERNWFKRDVDTWTTDLESYGDNGIYDLFLNYQEIGYDVPALYRLVDHVGLELVAFIGDRYESPSGYDPDSFVHDEALAEKIRELPRREQQAVAELMSGAIRKHTVYLARRAETVANLRELSNIPFFFGINRSKLQALVDSNPGEEITLSSPRGKLVFQPGEFLKSFVRLTDGKRTTAEILHLVKEATGESSTEKVYAELEAVFNLFNSLDWMLLRGGPRRS